MGTIYIYGILIIVFTPNLEFSPYSEVIHKSTIIKLTKGQKKVKEKWLAIQLDVSDPR